VKDKVGWVPELGDLVKTVCGPGGEVVGGLKGKSVGAVGVGGLKGKSVGAVGVDGSENL